MTHRIATASTPSPRLPVALAFDEMPMALAILAFDRSARNKDADGRLHVESSNISKSAVNPYLGREIPNWQELGLDPDKVYQLLRDPAELERAAPTFNNIPLLSKHVPVSVNDHQPDLVVGATGSHAVFDYPYLKNSLVIWEAVAIAGVETEVQCELSCAYRYTPIMEKGEFEGMPYDGRMTNIIGNHVALVEIGRAGADVVVADSKPNFEGKQTMTRKEKRIAAHAAALKIAQDAGISKKELARLLAMDAEAVAKEDDKKEPDVAEDDAKRDDESDEEYEARMKAKKEQASDEESDEDDDKPKEKKDDKGAMDAAIANAEANAVKRIQAIHAAELAVKPIIGDVVAQDSAEAVYALALDHLGIPTKSVHASAFKSIFEVATAGKKPVALATDSAGDTASQFRKDFPNAVIPKKG